MATINDLVLVHIDNKPGFFARIEDISPDVKPGWWQVKLLVLSIPLQIFTWTLDDNQINGEPYTMGGTPVRLERIVSPVETEGKTDHPGPVKAHADGEPKERAKVVSLKERQKKD